MNKLLFQIIKAYIAIKWFFDKQALNIPKHKQKVYKKSLLHFYKVFSSFPNLRNPVSLNEKIQWLKIFDETDFHVQCCDKLALREFVISCTGKDYCNEVYQQAESFDDLDFDSLPKSFVIKTNHDSGTVFVVNDKDNCDWGNIKKKVERSLSRTYGAGKGEWPYQFIEPKVFVEKDLSAQDGSMPADIKIHCASGKAVFIQYIYDRETGRTKESILSPEWMPMNLVLDTEFYRADGYVEKPGNLDELITIAEHLSLQFQYVRVDLYNVDSRPIVGELTFYPRGGYYPDGDQAELGKLVSIN